GGESLGQGEARRLRRLPRGHGRTAPVERPGVRDRPVLGGQAHQRVVFGHLHVVAVGRALGNAVELCPPQGKRAVAMVRYARDGRPGGLSREDAGGRVDEQVVVRALVQDHLAGRQDEHRELEVQVILQGRLQVGGHGRGVQRGDRVGGRVEIEEGGGRIYDLL